MIVQLAGTTTWKMSSSWRKRSLDRGMWVTGFVECDRLGKSEETRWMPRRWSPTRNGVRVTDVMTAHYLISVTAHGVVRDFQTSCTNDASSLTRYIRWQCVCERQSITSWLPAGRWFETSYLLSRRIESLTSSITNVALSMTRSYCTKTTGDTRTLIYFF